MYNGRKIETDAGRVQTESVIDVVKQNSCCKEGHKPCGFDGPIWENAANRVMV